MRTRSPSLTHQSPLLACLDPRRKDSQSASLEHRSLPRQCNTSCPSAPALWLARVTQNGTDSPARQDCATYHPDRGQARASRQISLGQTRQGPWPKIVLDPAPKASSDLWDRKRERPSPSAAGPTPKLSRLNLTFCSGCRGQCVFCSHWGPSSLPLLYNILQTFSKRDQISSSTQHEWGRPTWRQATRSNTTPRQVGPRPGRPSPECQTGLWG